VLRYAFTVEISSSPSGDAAYVFRVVGEAASNGQLITREYQLSGIQPSDYLDLFEAIAGDFGTRLPLHRAPQKRTHFEARYSELLTYNLCPEILYGYGDPAIFLANISNGARDELWYYLTCTFNDAPHCFPLIRSRDLTTWEARGFNFPYGQTPVWAGVGKDIADFWAPEIHQIGGEFRAYFVARESGRDTLCIGAATATSVEGPYAADAAPLLQGDRIDPHVFVDGDTPYLYWKEDSNAYWPVHLTDLLAGYPRLISQL
jgi:hypothetical protein